MPTFTPKRLAYVAGSKSTQAVLAYVVGNLLNPWEMDTVISEIHGGDLLNAGDGVWKTVQNMNALTTVDSVSAYSAGVTTNSVYARTFSSSTVGYMRSRNGLNGMPVTAGSVYRGEMWATNTSGSSETFRLNVVWFDATGAELSTSLLKERVGHTQNQWLGYTGTATAPAGAAFACLEFRKTTAVNVTIHFQGAAFFPTVADNVLRVIVKNVFSDTNLPVAWCIPAENRQRAMESNSANTLNLNDILPPKRYGAFHLYSANATYTIAQLNHPLELGDAVVVKLASDLKSWWMSGVEVSP